MKRAMFALSILSILLGCGGNGGGGDGGFNYTLVDQSPLSGGAGRWVFLEHDSSNGLHAAYTMQIGESPTTHEIIYVVPDDPTPIPETLATTQSYNLAFACAPDGTSHVIFYDGAYYYGNNSGGAWSSAALTPTGVSAYIMVDSNGYPWLPGHTDATTDRNRLVMSTTGGASWNNETISPMDPAAYLAGLCRDSTGRPLAVSRVSTMDDTTIGIYERGTVVWAGVDTEVFNYSEVRDVDVDSQGNVYLLVYSGGGIILRRLNRSTTFWDILWADNANDGTVAVGPGDKPYVAYVDGAGDLYVVYEAASGWRATLIDQFVQISTGPSGHGYDITVTSDGVVHVLYYDNLRAQLYYAAGTP